MAEYIKLEDGGFECSLCAEVVFGAEYLHHEQWCQALKLKNTVGNRDMAQGQQLCQQLNRQSDNDDGEDGHIGVAGDVVVDPVMYRDGNQPVNHDAQRFLEKCRQEMNQADVSKGKPGKGNCKMETAKEKKVNIGPPSKKRLKMSGSTTHAGNHVDHISSLPNTIIGGLEMTVDSGSESPNDSHTGGKRAARRKRKTYKYETEDEEFSSTPNSGTQRKLASLLLARQDQLKEFSSTPNSGTQHKLASLLLARQDQLKEAVANKQEALRKQCGAFSKDVTSNSSQGVVNHSDGGDKVSQSKSEVEDSRDATVNCVFCMTPFDIATEKKQFLGHLSVELHAHQGLSLKKANNYKEAIESTVQPLFPITILICPDCNCMFLDRDNFAFHVKKFHSKFACRKGTCCEAFTSKEKAISHEIVAHTRPVEIPKENQPGVCKVCNMIFATNRLLNLHLLQHNKPEIREAYINFQPRVCTICEMHFETDRALYAHTIEKHKGPDKVIFKSNKKSFKCLVCSKAFVTPVELTQHKNSASCGTVKKESYHSVFVCSVENCNAVIFNNANTSRLEKAKIHIAKYHPEDPPRWITSYFVCTQCNTKFNDYGTCLHHNQICRKRYLRQRAKGIIDVATESEEWSKGSRVTISWTEKLACSIPFISLLKTGEGGEGTRGSRVNSEVKCWLCHRGMPEEQFRAHINKAHSVMHLVQNEVRVDEENKANISKRLNNQNQLLEGGNVSERLEDRNQLSGDGSEAVSAESQCSDKDTTEIENQDDTQEPYKSASVLATSSAEDSEPQNRNVGKEPNISATIADTSLAKDNEYEKCDEGKEPNNSATIFDINLAKDNESEKWDVDKEPNYSASTIAKNNESQKWDVDKVPNNSATIFDTNLAKDNESEKWDVDKEPNYSASTIAKNNESQKCVVVKDLMIKGNISEAVASAKSSTSITDNAADNLLYIDDTQKTNTAEAAIETDLCYYKDTETENQLADTQKTNTAVAALATDLCSSKDKETENQLAQCDTTDRNIETKLRRRDDSMGTGENANNSDIDDIGNVEVKLQQHSSSMGTRTKENQSDNDVNRVIEKDTLDSKKDSNTVDKVAKTSDTENDRTVNDDNNEAEMSERERKVSSDSEEARMADTENDKKVNDERKDAEITKRERKVNNDTKISRTYGTENDRKVNDDRKDAENTKRERKGNNHTEEAQMSEREEVLATDMPQIGFSDTICDDKEETEYLMFQALNDDTHGDTAAVRETLAGGSDNVEEGTKVGEPQDGPVYSEITNNVEINEVQETKVPFNEDDGVVRQTKGYEVKDSTNVGKGRPVLPMDPEFNFSTRAEKTRPEWCTNPDNQSESETSQNTEVKQLKSTNTGAQYEPETAIKTEGVQSKSSNHGNQIEPEGDSKMAASDASGSLMELLKYRSRSTLSSYYGDESKLVASDADYGLQLKESGVSRLMGLSGSDNIKLEATEEMNESTFMGLDESDIKLEATEEMNQSTFMGLDESDIKLEATEEMNQSSFMGLAGVGSKHPVTAISAEYGGDTESDWESLPSSENPLDPEDGEYVPDVSEDDEYKDSMFENKYYNSDVYDQDEVIVKDGEDILQDSDYLNCVFGTEGGAAAKRGTENLGKGGGGVKSIRKSVEITDKRKSENFKVKVSTGAIRCRERKRKSTIAKIKVPGRSKVTDKTKVADKTNVDNADKVVVKDGEEEKHPNSDSLMGKLGVKVNPANPDERKAQSEGITSHMKLSKDGLVCIPTNKPDEDSKVVTVNKLGNTNNSPFKSKSRVIEMHCPYQGCVFHTQSTSEMSHHTINYHLDIDPALLPYKCRFGRCNAAFLFYKDYNAHVCGKEKALRSNFLEFYSQPKMKSIDGANEDIPSMVSNEGFAKKRRAEDGGETHNNYLRSPGTVSAAFSNEVPSKKRRTEDVGECSQSSRRSGKVCTATDEVVYDKKGTCDDYVVTYTDDSDTETNTDNPVQGLQGTVKVEPHSDNENVIEGTVKVEPKDDTENAFEGIRFETERDIENVIEGTVKLEPESDNENDFEGMVTIETVGDIENVIEGTVKLEPESDIEHSPVDNPDSINDWEVEGKEKDFPDESVTKATQRFPEDARNLVLHSPSGTLPSNLKGTNPALKKLGPSWTSDVSNKYIKCKEPSCGFWCESKAQYSKHYMQCHLDIDPNLLPYRCTKQGCQEAFVMKSDLVKHRKVCKGEAHKPRHMCRGCNSTYLLFPPFQLHLETCVGSATGKPRYGLNDESKPVDDNAMPVASVGKQTGDSGNSMIMTCSRDGCEFACTDINEFQDHFNNHLLFSYDCKTPGCFASFSIIWDLKKHMLSCGQVKVGNRLRKDNRLQNEKRLQNKNQLQNKKRLQNQNRLQNKKRLQNEKQLQIENQLQNQVQNEKRSQNESQIQNAWANLTKTLKTTTQPKHGRKTGKEGPNASEESQTPRKKKKRMMHTNFTIVKRKKRNSLGQLKLTTTVKQEPVGDSELTSVKYDENVGGFYVEKIAGRKSSLQGSGEQCPTPSTSAQRPAKESTVMQHTSSKKSTLKRGATKQITATSSIAGPKKTPLPRVTRQSTAVSPISEKTPLPRARRQSTAVSPISKKGPLSGTTNKSITPSASPRKSKPSNSQAVDLQNLQMNVTSVDDYDADSKVVAEKPKVSAKTNLRQKGKKKKPKYSLSNVRQKPETNMKKQSDGSQNIGSSQNLSSQHWQQSLVEDARQTRRITRNCNRIGAGVPIVPVVQFWNNESSEQETSGQGLRLLCPKRLQVNVIRCDYLLTNGRTALLSKPKYSIKKGSTEDVDNEKVNSKALLKIVKWPKAGCSNRLTKVVENACTNSVSMETKAHSSSGASTKSAAKVTNSFGASTNSVSKETKVHSSSGASTTSVAKETRANRISSASTTSVAKGTKANRSPGVKRLKGKSNAVAKKSTTKAHHSSRVKATKGNLDIFRSQAKLIEFPCSDCDMIFASPEDMYKHCSEAHIKSEPISTFDESSKDVNLYNHYSEADIKTEPPSMFDESSKDFNLHKHCSEVHTRNDPISMFEESSSEVHTRNESNTFDESSKDAETEADDPPVPVFCVENSSLRLSGEGIVDSGMEGLSNALFPVNAVKVKTEPVDNEELPKQTKCIVKMGLSNRGKMDMQTTVNRRFLSNRVVDTELPRPNTAIVVISKEACDRSFGNIEIKPEPEEVGDDLIEDFTIVENDDEDTTDGSEIIMAGPCNAAETEAEPFNASEAGRCMESQSDARPCMETEAGRCMESETEAVCCMESETEAGRCMETEAGHCMESESEAGCCLESETEVGRCLESEIEAGRSMASQSEAVPCNEAENDSIIDATDFTIEKNDDVDTIDDITEDQLMELGSND